MLLIYDLVEYVRYELDNKSAVLLPRRNFFDKGGSYNTD
jgi:hypothetical protein